MAAFLAAKSLSETGLCVYKVALLFLCVLLSVLHASEARRADLQSTKEALNKSIVTPRDLKRTDSRGCDSIL